MNGILSVWRHIWTSPVETEPRLQNTGPPTGPPIENQVSITKPAIEQDHKPKAPRILIAKPKQRPLNRNDKIRQSLEHAYPSNHKDILDQAYAAYYFSRPASENLTELYELLESGFIDQGLEACGLGQWAIGRPK